MHIEMEHISGPETFDKGSEITVAIYGSNMTLFKIQAWTIVLDYDTRILKIADAESKFHVINFQNATHVNFNSAGNPKQFKDFELMARVVFFIVADKADIGNDSFFISVEKVTLVGDSTKATTHIKSNVSLGFDPQRMHPE